MNHYRLPGSKFGSWFYAISIFFLLGLSSLSAQIGLHVHQYKPPFSPLFFNRKSVPSPFYRSVSAQYPRYVIQKINLDPDKGIVSSGLYIGDWEFIPPRILSFSDYVNLRSSVLIRDQWKQYAKGHTKLSQSQKGRNRGIVLESPKIKSEAFRRMFGGETLSLNVTGRITIDGGIRHEKRSQVKTALTRRPNTNFEMKQTQQFRVEGKIGNNVSIFVDQDSERPFEFQNAFKLRYSSDEDGIIQSIQAGNVALSLPSTRFVTFSSNNSGLFGIKTDMKVGKLNVTAIASMEKGEKKRLSLSGGKKENSFKIQDYDYKKATYFFLGYDYRTQYPHVDSKGQHIISTDNIINDIQVWKSDANIDENTSGVRYAWAVVNPSQSVDTTANASNEENRQHWFVPLEANKDFYINKQLGFIYMNMPLQDSEVLAVSYIKTNGDTIGTWINDVADTTVSKSKRLVYKIIKPRSARPSDATWNLEWKNVYSLGGRNIDKDGFELRIFYKVPSGTPKESIQVNGKERALLNLFGLDKADVNGQPNPDDVIDIDPNILSLSRGEVIFPDLRPFDPGNGSGSDLPRDYWSSVIYDTTSVSAIRNQSKFYMEVKSSSVSPVHELGMNVIENSEKVLLNGTTLTKDVDYRIDYLTGTLTILNEQALNPNANLEISYESQQLFTIDKKTLMGARAEYTLWEDGNKRSFIGGTFLYLSQTTMDKRIRVGKDAPMKNFVWDVNTALSFKPDFLTKAFNALPLLNLEQPSSMSFEGEYAQVVPNPNTLNNDATDDKNGVAYLDDFESAKRKINLGVTRYAWGPSSLPYDRSDHLLSLQDKGSIYWYNPYNQVSIQEIWPDREVTNNFGGTTRTNVLAVHFTPNPTLQDKAKSWGGIMRALSAGFFDQSESKYLEIMVRGNNGRLHIDLGRVSEDVIPNNIRDTEDKSTETRARNNLLDEDEDTGIDGMFGPDPPELFWPHDPSAAVVNGRATLYDFWDINGDGIKEADEPWSYDDWEYVSGSYDYTHINGTENNRNDGAQIPNSEDLNHNSGVDLNNDYFEYSFSLEKDSPDTALIAGQKNNTAGWRLYRIPLRSPSMIKGTPDWSRIEFVRIWADSMQTESLFEIVEINLTGNEWKFKGKELKGDSTFVITPGDSTLNISVVNTHDNPEYTQPPGVEGVIDPIQKIRSKEQSLVLGLTDLEPGAAVLAHKQLYSSENLINYNYLKMFVYGMDKYDFYESLQDSLEFFLRWGSDTQNRVYYEVKIPLYSGWDKRNNIEVSFEDLSRLKIEMEAAGKDTISEVQANGHIITIVGKPSLTNIRWIAAGVINKGKEPFYGTVWMDELRLSSVKKDKGKAMRFKADLRLSDFIVMNGEFQRTEADFHTINERFGKGSTTLGTRAFMSMNLDKFTPEHWGLSIPISANYAKTQSTPKYKPGSDILVNKRTVPDSLMPEIRTDNESLGLNAAFKKRTKSRNFLVRYLIDPIDAKASLTKAKSSNPVVASGRKLQYKGSFSYRIGFGNQHYFLPFKWAGSFGLLKKFAKTKFYYLPSNFSFSLQGSDSEDESRKRSGVNSSVFKSNFTRTLAVNYKPFNVISADYSKTQQFDMLHSKWMDVVSSFTEPGMPLSVSQNANLNLSPKIFSWFTTTGKYSASYRWSDNPAIRTTGTSRSSTINTTMTFTGTFTPKRFVQYFKVKKKSAFARKRRTPVTRRRKPSADAKKDSKTKKKDEKKSGGFFLRPAFYLFGKLIEKIDPVSVSMRNNITASHYGLQGTPSAQYQFGLTDDPGVPLSENVTQRSSTQKNRNISFRSGFKIIKNLATTLNYVYTNAESRSTQVTGNVSYSVLSLNSTPIPFPSWTVRLTGIERLPFISKFMRSIVVSHAFTGKKSETWKDSTSTPTQRTVTKDFRPFIGANFAFKNGITASFQYNTSESIQEKMLVSSGITKNTSSQINVTARYNLKKGIKLPFLKKRFNNNIDISVTFQSSVNVSARKQAGKTNFTDMSNTMNWSFKPTITYSFTKTVNGGLHFELGKRKDLRAGTTDIKGFGINATISLGG